MQPRSRRALVCAATLSFGVLAVLAILALRPANSPAAMKEDDQIRSCRDRAKSAERAAMDQCKFGRETCLSSRCAGSSRGRCSRMCKNDESACKADAESRSASAEADCYRQVPAPSPAPLPVSSSWSRSTHRSRSSLGASAAGDVDDLMPSKYPNPFCRGKMEDPPEPDKDGNGYICSKAVGKPGCQTVVQLLGPYCACCECYVQCGMADTLFAGCDAKLCTASHDEPQPAAPLGAPVPHDSLGGALPYGPNSYCVGNKNRPSDISSPSKDGLGYVCSRAQAKPYCNSVEELATEYCACCYCYSQCSLQHTASFGCRSKYMCGYGPDWTPGESISAAPVPHSGSGRLDSPTVYRNPYCIGKMQMPPNLDKDGNGYICKKAVGHPHCQTEDELASLYCACCQCYTQCGMGSTINANCKPMCEAGAPIADSPPSASPAPVPTSLSAPLYFGPNAFCVGKKDAPTDPDDLGQDGHGYICSSARNRPFCTTVAELATEYCACCYCYNKCGLKNTASFGCESHYACGYGPGNSVGPSAQPAAPVPASLSAPLYFGPNAFCVGKKDAPTDPDDLGQDGHGYICSSARNRPFCTTVAELATEYCACCYCYNKCGLKNTASFGCESHYACGYGPGNSVGPSAQPAAPVPASLSAPLYFGPNAFCVGKKDAPTDPDDLGQDGHGYICSSARNRPFCTTVAELATEYCACCYCYNKCGLKNTASFGCESQYACGYGPGYHTGSGLGAAQPAAPVPTEVDSPAPFANAYCVGKMSAATMLGRTIDGSGLICKKAVGKPGCETTEQLGSLYCACCQCYTQCGMSNTRNANCKPMCTPPSPSPPPPAPPPWWHTGQTAGGGLQQQLLQGPSQYRNLWCSGHQGTHGTDASADGHGYLCQAAVGKPGCERPDQLASLYCACCYCYTECAMANTQQSSCSAANYCAHPPP